MKKLLLAAIVFSVIFGRASGVEEREALAKRQYG